MLANLKERMQVPLLLLPAMSVVFVLFMGGLIMGFMQSLGYMPIIGKTDITFDAYINIFTDEDFLRSLLLTAWIGFAATIFSTILAVIFALVLRQNLRGKRITTFIFQLNVAVPHIVGAIGVIFLFSQSGLISRLTQAIGLTSVQSEFPALVHDKYAIGIILEYLWKMTFFTGVILLAVLQSIGDDYEDAARSLGANAWQRFRFVIMPLIMPGILRASILVFAFAFGAFEIPFLLGQRYPRALPVLSFEYYHNVDLGFRREAMATSMIIAALITILILVYMKLTETYVRSD
ncbi:MAG: sugar ABC transporter permease [Chloroflexi bacterium]|nr:sugar ABC transporter permease [Chloroflexota bacterium]